MNKKLQINLFRSFGFRAVFAGTLALTGSKNLTAQEADTTTFKPHGQLWGVVYADFAYKGAADGANRETYQYSGMPVNTNVFDFRRVYLGYTYQISRSFTADLLVSSENDYASGALGSASNGDLLSDGKNAPFIKWANLRWKNIWKGTDLVLGQGNTPALGITARNSQTSEEVWAYRSIEKTVSDLRGTPVYDIGAALQGWFDETGNFGYDFMVANGTGARPETSTNKWFYGDVYAKFFNKRLVIDLYQDYERLNWGVYVPISATNSAPGHNGAWYHDRNMTKLFVAWNSEPFTIGFEGFQNTLLGDTKVTGKDGQTYYRTTKAMDMSFFIHGTILNDASGKMRLGYFARYDNYDPSGNVSNIVGEANTAKFTNVNAFYDPNTKEQYFVVGLDYKPFKNVHIMPNFMMFTYNSDLSQTAANDALNTNTTGIKGTDGVWRLTFWYSYGK